MVHGEIQGVKKSYLKELENLYEIKIDKNFIANEEIINTISRISLDINKEICVVVSRSGLIHSISIGSNSDVQIKVDLKEKKKLSNYRVIHTHLNSSPKLSNVDITSLKNLKLDAISAINVTDDKFLNGFSIGFLNPSDEDEYTEYLFDSLENYINFEIYNKIHEIEKNFKIDIYENKVEDNVVLVGCDTKESLDELKELSYACNLNVCGMYFQNLDKPDNAYYVGRGKLNEIRNDIYNKQINFLIFDDALSGTQLRTIEEITGIKVIDRTTLILEIFSRRAKSKVSKFQVELARLKYKYSRLRGLGSDLGRTIGGIGVRGGSGETKLETDRRYVRKRIDYLKEELKNIKLERSIQREARIKNNIPQVSIVGYTNAGKSTLRNLIYSITNSKDEDLTDKLVFEADMLFATLDTTVRKIVLPKNTMISLTDTVGFIKKLPHDLVDSFKSTLEEVIYSNILIHVVDISSPNWKQEIETTNSVLEEIGAINSNNILVFNKIDKLDETQLNNLKSEIDDLFSNEKIVFISTIERINIDLLLNTIEDSLNLNYTNIDVLIPYDDYSILNFIYNEYHIVKEEHHDNGTYVEVELPKQDIPKFEKYILEDLEK